MSSKSLKTLVALCAAFVVAAATMVSAHAELRAAQSTFVSLARAGSIVRWVLFKEHAPGARVRLVDVGVQAAGDAVEPAPPAPSAPAAPAAPRAGARAKAAKPASAADAQRAEPPDRPALPAMEAFSPVEFQRVRPVLRIGQDYVVRQGETVENVVIIAGSLRIEGRVRGDVVVVPGTVELTSTGEVDGNFVNVGGGMTVDAGGTVRGDLVTVGGALTAPAAFSPGGDQVIVGTPEVGEHIRGLLPWLTRGLMLGRVVVPTLGGTWLLIGILLFVAIVLSLVFEGPVRTCAETIVRRPVTTFFIGLLTLLLLGPISFLLAVSVVGIAVLPFLLCAIVAGWVLGKIGVARWLGAGVVRESEPDNRAQAVRSVVIGFALLTLAYMVPIIGLATWVIVGVLGLGAATSSVFKALRRENPAPPVPPVPPAPVPPYEPDAPAAGPPPVPAMPLASAPIVEDAPAAAPPPVAAAIPAQTYAPPIDHGAAALLALPRATFVQRVVAGALDFLIVMFIFQWLDLHRREMFWFFALLTAYNASFWAWRGTTIGGTIFQLRVVRTDGRPLVAGDCLVRGVSSVFSLIVAGLGFFWILLHTNHDRQAWHDLIAGTVVVRLPKSTPLR